MRYYFEHIQQVKDISWLYPLIEGNIDYMVMWWDEAIMRKLKPNISLKQIVEARIWNSNKQMEQVGKMVFYVQNDLRVPKN